MNDRQKVIEVLEGREVDHIPSLFSIHFNDKFGEKAIRAHLDFFRETDNEICKIMNEYRLPVIGRIEAGSDFAKVLRNSDDKKVYDPQFEMTKRITDEYGSEKFYTGTLHGITATALNIYDKSIYGSYDNRRKLLCEELREYTTEVSDMFKRIADGLCYEVEGYRKTGIDSVFFASLGGEDRFFTDEEFAEYIEPCEKQVLKTIKENGMYSILHICKDGLNMRRYAPYMEFTDAVNWGVYETDFSFEKAREIFGNRVTFIGGLANKSGAIVDGSDEELKEAVKNLVDRYGHSRFILGADCTLPTEISYSRIKLMSDYLKEI